VYGAGRPGGEKLLRNDRRPQNEGRPQSEGRPQNEGRRDAATATDAIRDLFDDNAAHYDRVNRIITFAQDARWRRWAAREAVAGASAREGARGSAGAERVTGAETLAGAGRALDPSSPCRVLDACAGTGLAGLEAARLGARVTLADVSAGMLVVARERAAARRLTVDDCVVDLAAAPPPFAPGSFDAAIIAFGLRYFSDPVAVVGGLAAVLRPGGELVVLEAVVPPAGPVHRAAEMYFMRVAPLVATGLAGRSALYRVLTATTRETGGAGDVLAILRAAGLGVVSRRDFAVGLVVGVVARKAL
jgi:demethylmenaquinone methyltransferase / 2-methoxy-6-polyprenyl-1,4-benzoquinol methylase